MAKDHSPVPHTCPLINEVISFIGSVEGPSDQDEVEDFINSQIDAEKTMEKIRAANGKLREWGNEMCNEMDEARDEVDDLKKDLDTHERTIEALREEVKSLEREVESFGSKVVELEDAQNCEA